MSPTVWSCKILVQHCCSFMIWDWGVAVVCTTATSTCMDSVLCSRTFQVILICYCSQWAWFMWLWSVLWTAHVWFVKEAIVELAYDNTFTVMLRPLGMCWTALIHHLRWPWTLHWSVQVWSHCFAAWIHLHCSAQRLIQGGWIGWLAIPPCTCHAWQCLCYTSSLRWVLSYFDNKQLYLSSDGSRFNHRACTFQNFLGWACPQTP